MKDTDKVFKCTGCSSKMIITKIQIKKNDIKCIECDLKKRKYKFIPAALRTLPKSHLGHGGYLHG